MTFFQKVFILLYFLQGEISCEVWSMNPFNFFSPMNMVKGVVTRAPGVKSGMKFYELITDKKARNSFLSGHLVPNLVPMAAAGYISHRCFQGAFSEYANSGIAKVILFGSVGLLAVRGSLHSYEKKKELEGIKEALDQNGIGIANANRKLDEVQATMTDMKAQLAAAAVTAQQTAGAVGQVAGDVRVIKGTQRILAFATFKLCNVFKRHGVLLGNIQAQMGADRANQERMHSETTATLSRLEEAQDALGKKIDTFSKAQADHNQLMTTQTSEILQAVSPSRKQRANLQSQDKLDEVD